MCRCIDAGRVTNVYPDRGTARVLYEERNQLSGELIVLNRNLYAVEDQQMPRVGAKVVCGMLPNSNEGFIFGAYPTADEP